MQTPGQKQMTAIRDLIRAEILAAQTASQPLAAQLASTRFTITEAATRDYEAHMAFVAMCEAFGISTD